MKKKISPLNKLRKENKELKALVNSYGEARDYWRKEHDILKESFEMYKKNPSNIFADKQMLVERIRLVSNIGQLTEAVSKAIMVIVGKEVM